MIKDNLPEQIGLIVIFNIFHISVGGEDKTEKDLEKGGEGGKDPETAGGEADPADQETVDPAP